MASADHPTRAAALTTAIVVLAARVPARAGPAPADLAASATTSSSATLNLSRSVSPDLYRSITLSIITFDARCLSWSNVSRVDSSTKTRKGAFTASKSAPGRIAAKNLSGQSLANSSGRPSKMVPLTYASHSGIPNSVS